MSVPKALPLTAPSTSEGNNSNSVIAHWARRVVNSLPGPGAIAGLFAASLGLGMLTAYAIDNNWQKEEDFNDWYQFVTRVSIIVPSVVGLFILSSTINLTVIATFACLTSGFIVGLKAAKYFIDRSDHRIVQVAEQLVAQ